MDDLTEVITSACFHPKEEHSSYFAYCSSKGTVSLCDMRQSTRCNGYVVQIFEELAQKQQKTFFSEIIESVSDVQFYPVVSGSSDYLLSRDFMNLKLWDFRNAKQPYKKFDIHENLRNYFSKMYENESLFDQFNCVFSAPRSNQHAGKFVMTGSYKNQFHIFETFGKKHTKIEVKKLFEYQNNKSAGSVDLTKPDKNHKNVVYGEKDFQRKCLKMSAHPKDLLVAVAIENELFLFEAE